MKRGRACVEGVSVICVLTCEIKYVLETRCVTEMFMYIAVTDGNIRVTGTRRVEIQILTVRDKRKYTCYRYATSGSTNIDLRDKRKYRCYRYATSGSTNIDCT